LIQIGQINHIFKWSFSCPILIYDLQQQLLQKKLYVFIIIFFVALKNHYLHNDRAKSFNLGCNNFSNTAIKKKYYAHG
jgi:hypothetical protein